MYHTLRNREAPRHLVELLDLPQEETSCAVLMVLDNAIQLRCSLMERISDLLTMDDAETVDILTSSGRSLATRELLLILVAESIR